ncbi:MAG: TIGR03621 family F420-dependent LLM class oxidoreductase [Thermomicrobiales bacterium]
MSGRRPFRFGVINEHMTTRAGWVESARKAEELGYATMLIRDHFVPDFFGDQFAPLAAMMSAADSTTTLRIGTLVIDNDYRHPVVLAKETATIDLLSDGRLELGLGAGWLEREYIVAGLDYDRPGVRIDRVEEAIAVLKGLWGDGPVNFSGQHYHITDLEGYPKPAQRPGPSLLIGAGHPRMLRIAGREADIVGFLTTSVATGTVVDVPTNRMWETVEKQVGYVREGAGDRFDQIELSGIVTLLITDRRRTQTEELIRARGWNELSVEDVWSMPFVFIGSIDEIAEQMRERRERLGFSYFIVDDANIDTLAPIVAKLAGT